VDAGSIDAYRKADEYRDQGWARITQIGQCLTEDFAMKSWKQKGNWILPLLLTVSLTPNAWSQGKGKGKGNHKESQGSETATAVVLFGQRDQNLIRDWFWDNRNGLPPRLAKRESLPPGLQKQLRRNGTLPPGLQKKLVVLPVSLESRLSKLPGDLVRVVLGRDLVLMDRRSDTILDLLPGVLYGANDENLYRADRLDQDDDDDREARRDENEYRNSRREPAITAPRATTGSTVASPPAIAKPSYSAAPSSGPNNAQSIPLKVRLTRTISTASVNTGDRFTATLEESLYENGKIVARQGASVEGVIADADKGGRVKGVASITLALARIQLQSGRYLNVTSDPVRAEADSTKAKDAAKVGIMTGIGAGIGALAGGGKGAAIGAVSGAGAGTGLVLITRGEAAELPSETVLEFNIRAI
jgi:hypothetical protein